MSWLDRWRDTVDQSRLGDDIKAFAREIAEESRRHGADIIKIMPVNLEAMARRTGVSSGLVDSCVLQLQWAGLIEVPSWSSSNGGHWYRLIPPAIPGLGDW